MKTAILLSFFSLNIYASDFKGCGEYILKGVLREKSSEDTSESIYIVNENTKSQMIFELGPRETTIMLPMINKTSSLKGTIFKMMDGTKGKLKNIEKISIRFPNPLAPGDTGMVLIKSLKCD